MQIDNLWCLGYAFAVCYASQGKQVTSILCCRLFVGLSCSWQVRGTLHLHLNHHERIQLPRKVHCSENMLYQVLTCYNAVEHKVCLLLSWIFAEMHRQRYVKVTLVIRFTLGLMLGFGVYADLVRSIEPTPLGLEMDFVRISSYVGTQSSGKARQNLFTECWWQ